MINPPDEAALSRAYASLAVVSYTDHARTEFLAPVCQADADRRGAGRCPQVPHRESVVSQETTAEQFFNEAQWESYRKLGEHIASKLFGDSGVVPPEKFTPRLGLDGHIKWEVLRIFAQA